MTFRVVKPVFFFLRLTVLVMQFAGIFIAFKTGAFAASGLIFLALTLLTFKSVRQGYFESIILDENSVKYKGLFINYEMPWSEIKLIGIGLINSITYLYFSAGAIPQIELRPGMVNDKFFMAQYRKIITDSVALYWKGEIAGRDSVNSIEKIREARQNRQGENDGLDYGGRFEELRRARKNRNGDL